MAISLMHPLRTPQRTDMNAVSPLKRPSLRRLFDRSEVAVRWSDDSPVSGEYPTALGTIKVHHGTLLSGKSAGLEVCLVDTGTAEVVLLPGRGMAIWQMRAGGIDFGWRSPVDGPVHPSWVPIDSADGLGWLEGFDELVVRCGLESNGAPEKADDGSVRYPLHGRIANLPATGLSVEVNVSTGELAIVADVIESKLFFKRLRLHTRTVFTAGSASVGIVDEVHNDLGREATAQMLYHINIGEPVLGDGSRVIAPIRQVAPKDALSAGEIDQWNEMGPPQPGYAERVYFSQLHAGDDGWSSAMLRSADGQAGLGVSIDTTTLPYFILWKNTAGESDGYVAGLEPATNFPNARTRESDQGRVIKIAAGHSVVFRLGLHPLVSRQEVADFESRVDASAAETTVLREPVAAWSV
jgi:hypothetical protein